MFAEKVQMTRVLIGKNAYLKKGAFYNHPKAKHSFCDISAYDT